MASSAAHISVSTGAAIPAPQSKTHNKASRGDGFADMLAASDAAAPQGNARANAAQPKEKSAPTDKATGKTAAADNKATDAKETPKTPEGGQTDVQAGVQAKTDADTNVAVQDADALTGSVTEELADATAANDNNAADVTAALPQPTQPAPQPTQNPALAFAMGNTAQNAAPSGAETDTGNADAEPALAAANIVPAQAARPETANAQPDADSGKAAGAAKPEADATAIAPKTAQAEAGDFQKILNDASGQADAAEPAPALAETSAEAPATPAAKPSPELNTITLAAPPAQAHAATGADKPAATAHVQTPHQPQATPNVEQFAVDVAARSQSGAKQFDIRLDPPELGRVEVRLSIDAHGKAEAHLTADQPQTLELLQKDAPALARALRDAGLNVNQDALNFSLKNQQNHAGGEDNSRGGARHGFGNSGNNNEPRIEEAAAYVRRSLGVLDIRV